MGIRCKYVFYLLKNGIFSNLEYRIAILTFDLGQNMAGWCRLRFKGVRGYGVYIRQGEVLTQPPITTK